MKRTESESAALGRPPRTRLATRLERILWWAGCALLGAALTIVADAAWYQRRAAAQLDATDAGDFTPAPARLVGEAPAVAAGTPLARLVIPRLGARVVVAEGVSDAVLRRAVGRLPESARLDESGNVALAGHRDTFFRPLEQIRAGDRIVLERGGARSEYEVEWAAVVEPSAVEVTADSGYPALTLVTCFPFAYVGDAPYRYVVRARRLDAAPPTGRAAS